jgi:hypothetical protein
VTEITVLLESVSQAANSKAIERVFGVVDGIDRNAAEKPASNISPLLKATKRCR